MLSFISPIKGTFLIFDQYEFILKYLSKTSKKSSSPDLKFSGILSSNSKVAS